MLQSKFYQVKICLYHCNIVRSPPINFDEDMYFISPNIYQFYQISIYSAQKESRRNETENQINKLFFNKFFNKISKLEFLWFKYHVQDCSLSSQTAINCSKWQNLIVLAWSDKNILYISFPILFLQILNVNDKAEFFLHFCPCIGGLYFYQFDKSSLLRPTEFYYRSLLSRLCAALD